MTINNTPGVRVFLAFAAALLLALVVLGVYGGVQIITADNGPKAQPQGTESSVTRQPTAQENKGGDGSTDGPKTLTAEEANAALPVKENLPPGPSGWSVFDDDHHLAQEDHELSDCLADGTMFENDVPKDGGGGYLTAWFRIYACSSPARAAALFDEFDPTDKGTAIPLPPLGNERTAFAFGGDSSKAATSLVRMGTVVVKLDYYWFGSLPAHQDRITQLTRVAAERVQRALAST
ncbi:hypothetical protein [Streptomyces lonegramiae]|uniref:PknH-like extracellular domain-containing protein n=1 Tax=Streptomyces lonegramiae TaxID=3075524 RepID=A0ABU2XUZ5_9ACTN|nr:hypothetical protein [Streptomyces sp. DSM 41529]MDT0549302.1 hypothetical protein [Streptomyces sp. DSM 41529]